MPAKNQWSAKDAKNAKKSQSGFLFKKLFSRPLRPSRTNALFDNVPVRAYRGHGPLLRVGGQSLLALAGRILKPTLRSPVSANLRISTATWPGFSG